VLTAEAYSVSAAAVGTALAYRMHWTVFETWYAAQSLSASWAVAIG
jgi:hypothetical protein